VRCQSLVAMLSAYLVCHVVCLPRILSSSLESVCPALDVPIAYIPRDLCSLVPRAWRTTEFDLKPVLCGPQENLQTTRPVFSDASPILANQIQMWDLPTSASESVSGSTVGHSTGLRSVPPVV
jgi:hypothetical protein